MDQVSLFANEAFETTATKEVKVNLSHKHLIRLHSMKLLTGQNISTTVTKAIAEYFARLEQAPAPTQVE